MRGMEMMLSAMFKGLGLEPDAVMKSIASISQVAMNVDARMQRIEEQLARIEALQRGEVPPAVNQPHIQIDGERVNGNAG